MSRSFKFRNLDEPQDVPDSQGASPTAESEAATPIDDAADLHDAADLNDVADLHDRADLHDAAGIEEPVADEAAFQDDGMDEYLPEPANDEADGVSLPESDLTLGGEAWDATGPLEPVNSAAWEQVVSTVVTEIADHEVDIVLQPVEDQPESLAPSMGSIAGGVMSVVFHVWLFSTLATILVGEQAQVYSPSIESHFSQVEEVLEVPEVIPYELANPDDRELEVQKAVNAKSVGMDVVQFQPELKSAPVPITADLRPDPVRPMYDIPQGLEFSDKVVIKGTTGEAVVQIESALDRVTWEVAQNLMERKVLLVWMIDASGSLTEQRQAIIKRFTRVYTELQALEKTGQLVPRAEQPLLTGVVSYGEKINFVTQEPTDDFQTIVDGVAKAPIDTSGKENVFGAVDTMTKKWAKYRHDQGRTIMTVIVTDETGDDFGHLEATIATCRRYGAKCYVIGPPAVFGRRQGFVPYVAPEDGKTYNLPVDLGPETFALEAVHMPFWFNGPQYDYLSAGMGPYGLSRLVRETGGVYFMTGMTTSKGFSPVGLFAADDMKPFAPDYKFGIPQDYINDVNRHPLRRAVMMAAENASKLKFKGTPDLEMKVTQQNFQQTLNTAQRNAAETIYYLDQLLAGFPQLPQSLEAEWQKETSPRWRVNYDLCLGRLYALKVRAYEYNFACAQLKGLGPQEVASKSNHWYFKPDAELNSGAVMKKMANEADRLLKRVVAEAPGTPWALLASRELAHPLGVKVIQKYDPPPPPPTATPNNNNDPKKKAVQLANDPVAKKKAAPPPPKPAPPALPKL